MLHFILGGARSGKSRFAQQQAIELSERTHKPVTYIATATAIDEEMRQRIERHQQERPDHWQLLEEPLMLVDALASVNKEHIILIDCLTLWLNNQLYHFPDQDFAQLLESLTLALTNAEQDVILVANEVGLGIIPMGEVSRQFVGQAGWLNQTLAAMVDKVSFVAAGLPMTLKDESVITTENKGL